MHAMTVLRTPTSGQLTDGSVHLHASGTCVRCGPRSTRSADLRAIEDVE